MLSGKSEIQVTKEGKRFMVVCYNATTRDWSQALAAARNRHPGCGCLPVKCISDSGRYRIEGEPVREMPLGPHRMAVEPPQPAPERARNDDQAEGVQSGTPEAAELAALLNKDFSAMETVSEKVSVGFRI